jgi:hypothetical protein
MAPSVSNAGFLLLLMAVTAECSTSRCAFQLLPLPGALSESCQLSKLQLLLQQSFRPHAPHPSEAPEHVFSCIICTMCCQHLQVLHYFR